MDYDNTDCMVFSDEEKLINFLENKIIEIEIKSKIDSTRNYYDFKKLTNDITKSINHISKYGMTVYIIKHMILTTSNLERWVF